MEVDLDVDLYWHGMAIMGCRVKSVLFHGFDSLFVEPHSERTDNADITGGALFVHHQMQNDDTLYPGLSCFVRVFGVWGEAESWLGHTFSRRRVEGFCV